MKSDQAVGEGEKAAEEEMGASGERFRDQGAWEVCGPGLEYSSKGSGSSY